MGFCWSTPCQHPLKQALNAPAPTIFPTKYGVRGREKTGEGKQAGGRRGGGQKPPAQTDPTVFNFNQLYARPLFILPPSLSLSLSLHQALSVSHSPSLSVFLSLSLCLPNNGLFVMQEASSTSIIRPSFHPPITTITATTTSSSAAINMEMSRSQSLVISSSVH